MSSIGDDTSDQQLNVSNMHAKNQRRLEVLEAEVREITSRTEQAHAALKADILKQIHEIIPSESNLEFQKYISDTLKGD